MERVHAAKQAIESAPTVTRELLVEYGRALNEEIIRRQGIVYSVRDEHERMIKTLITQYDGIAAILGLFPRNDQC